LNLTLWDLLEPLIPGMRRKKPPAPQRARPPQRPRGRVAPRPSAPAALASPAATGAPTAAANARSRKSAPDRAGESMQEKYDRVTREMLEQYGVRVRKWRSGMTGLAWYVTYRDGSIQRLIEAPRPRGPMSAAVFLHEIGHHAIGFDTYKPRCLEEYHAWRWSLEQMELLGLNVTDQVRLRMHQSLHYAVQKAQRRGIKQVPVELHPFLEKPRRSREKSRATTRA
jgi:hypothetical protein